MLTLYTRRRITNFATLSLSMAAMAFGLFWLLWIMYTLISSGASAISIDLFTKTTPAPGSEGGLANAILGSLQMTIGGTLLGTPIGILAGIYLAEFGSKGWVAPTTRFINDILLSAPSIVIGLFVYGAMVAQMGHFSGWAGIVALAILVIPVVLRTTENMLKLIPTAMREAAYALGCPQWKMTLFITLRAAKSGVITGILLAVARISGETAPLLFTALNNQFYSNLNQPMANLPMVIFQFAMSPFEDWHALAWAGSLLIGLFVLGLNVLARILTRQQGSH
ncbi:phosphate ABC transporter permease PstA [Chitinilyticum aquatile]|uniref:phosphate ABC transporter permease PstA n=1 Tax=Chitinilyticum aquatile TaxID=362520 RepID=UPI00041A59DB|nr:phosphate ABC transporter permease PstA [Chitinilyticum aquatile]